MSNLYKHVKSDKIKWIATGIALLLISLIITGVCLQVFGKGRVKPSEWFKKDDEQTDIAPDPEDNGLIITPTESKSGMRLNVQKASANASNGNVTETYTVTATVKPDYADDKSVEWSLEYAPVLYLDREVVLTEDGNRFYYVGEDPDNSENLMWDSTVGGLLKWIRTNPDPATFVTITPTSNGAAAATVKCLNGFRSKIILVATLRADNTVKATCTLEHYAHVCGVIIGVQYTIDDISFDGTTKGVIYKYSSSNVSRSVGVTAQLNTTLFTNEISYELQFATVTSVRISESAEYVAELNKTGLFKSAATAHTKVLSRSTDSVFRAVTSGKGFPLALADSTLYNLTTAAERQSAMCYALRNLGDRPFFTIQVTYEYPDAAVERLGLTKTHIITVPIYADLDDLSVPAANVSLDTSGIVF